MAFVDVLGFEMVTLVLAAVVLAYVAATGLFAYRRRGPEGVRGTLRAGAVPLGMVGFTATGLGLWGQMAWPLPGSYNILFSDVYLLFGLVLLAFAGSILLNLPTQFAGLFAAVAGASTVFYGYSAYQLGMTREPLSMLLLFLGFGVAGLAAFPATLALDGLMTGPAALVTPSGTAHPIPGRRLFRPLGRRAAQAVVSVGVHTAKGSEEPSERADLADVVRFAIPRYFTAMVVVFVIVVTLAAIAAAGFVDSTIPSHLSSAP